MLASTRLSGRSHVSEYRSISQTCSDGKIGIAVGVLAPSRCPLAGLAGFHSPSQAWAVPHKLCDHHQPRNRAKHMATHPSRTPPLDLPSLSPPARLAVFVSGGGSNMRAIHNAIKEGRINATIEVIVSDIPSCGGVAYAHQHSIPTLTYPIPKKGGFPGLTPEELVASLRDEHQIDYVLLAGYLKLIPKVLVSAFPRRMLNIHPGLLPSFGGKGMYGERVHQAVVASGTRFTGPTVHFVDENFDTGPILAQRVVEVNPLDSYKQVAAKVLKQEHQLYPEAVSALVDGRLTWREDGIPIMWSSH